MAFDRIIQMDVGKSGAFVATRASDLYIKFEIERSADITKNYAKFSVYNAKEDTRKLLSTSGNNIRFSAGYRDENNIKTIFIGSIFNAFSKKEEANWVTDIQAIDFGSNMFSITGIIPAYSNNVVNISYKEKTPLTTIVKDIGALFGIIVTGLENISGFVVSNSFNHNGYASALLQKIINTLEAFGMIAFFDNAELVITPKNSPDSRFSVVRLTPNNGLLGKIEFVTDDKPEDKTAKPDYIQFNCLLNPNIKPRCVVNVQSEAISGNFIVHKVNFIGNNFGGDFFSRVVAEYF